MIAFGIVSEVQTKITLRAGESTQTAERWAYIRMGEKCQLPLSQFWVRDEGCEFGAGDEICLRLDLK